MNRQFIILVIVALAITAALGHSNTSLRRNPVTSTQNLAVQRVIAVKHDFDPPVRIIAVKTKNHTIETRKSFVDEDDWFKDLKIRVINNSDAPVSYIGFDLTFRRVEGLPAGWPFNYGADPFNYPSAEAMPLSTVTPISPRETVELSISEREYAEIRRFIDNVGFTRAGNRLDVRIMKVGFTDGTCWNTGRIYQRDSEPNKWKRTTGDETPLIHRGRPQGSAQKRTAFFAGIAKQAKC